MTCYYNRDGIRITERWLSVGSHRYPLDRLRNIRMARGRGDRVARRAAYAATVSLLVLALTVRQVPPAVSAAGVTVLVVLPALVAAARARLVRPAYLLWADYHGTTVQLYETRDETTFGKMSRALLRASNRGRP